MLFKPEHIKMIEDGNKTATRRIWERWHIKVGGIYPAQVRMYQPKIECPLIRVNNRYLQALGDMTEKDADKEGGYTLNQFIKRFEEITKRTWEPELVVYVGEFEYVGRMDKIK